MLSINAEIRTEANTISVYSRNTFLLPIPRKKFPMSSIIPTASTQAIIMNKDTKNKIVSKSTDDFKVLNTFCLFLRTWNTSDAIPNTIHITPFVTSTPPIIIPNGKKDDTTRHTKFASNSMVGTIEDAVEKAKTMKE